MDSFEASKRIYGRISKLESEYVAKKIIGYIYLKGLMEIEIVRLAFGSDSLIQDFIKIAKTELFPNPLSQFSSSSSSIAPPYHNVTPYSRSFPNDYNCAEADFNSLGIRGSRNSDSSHEFNSLGIRGSRNSQSLIDSSHHVPKTCHYYLKGYCKHGSNCRYSHRDLSPENYPHNLSYEEDQEIFLKLDMEIVEILMSRGGNPVSIASLPGMYYEKYGKSLGDGSLGYLTESQRHGKSGNTLTKLLARLKSIKLIDRPHGQHDVILAGDAPKYIMEGRNQRNDPGQIVNGARQIYMTFPAESTFTEEDVSDHFSTYGPVQEVRIPCQQQRMFGFVTFVTAETVKLILSKGATTPHYICGARVLVKPYREKSKQIERNYHENLDHLMYLRSQPIDIDSELEARRRFLIEEQKLAMEREALRLSQLQVARSPLAIPSSFGHSMDELNVPEDHANFPSADRLSYLFNFDFLNSEDDHKTHESTMAKDFLPEIPFAKSSGV